MTASRRKLADFAAQDTLDVPEAAEVLGVSQRTYYAMAREGTVPHLRVGPRRVVVPRQQLERYLEGSWSPPPAAVREAIRVVTGIGGGG